MASSTATTATSTSTAGAPPLGALRRRLATRRNRIGLANAAPIVVYLLLLFVYPIIGTLLLSLRGGNSRGLTLSWYAHALSGGDLTVLLTTLRISAETAVLSLLIGFVLAVAVSRLRPLFAGAVMLVVVVPHFISALVRTYGWIILLGDHGLVNQLLTSLGVPGAPFQLLYNETGVVIGTTSVMLPYTVLVLYGVVRGVDGRLLAAAASLGAGRVRTLLRVYLPLVAPGLVSAGLLSFILSLGYYITPALMGGTHQTVVASLMNTQVMKENQWNEAAAQGIVLLLITFAGLLVLALGRRLGERRRGASR